MDSQDPQDPADEVQPQFRPTIVLVAHIDVYSEDGKDYPYLLIMKKICHTKKPNKIYDVTWEVGDTRGHEIRLVEVRPQVGPDVGSVRNPVSVNKEKGIRYTVNVRSSPFKYDLMYEIDGGETCEAYAERPGERPTCKQVRILGRNPPPEIWVP